MRKVKTVIFAALLGMLTGCATIPALTGNAVLPMDSDGAMKQGTEFKDLPADIRDGLIYGG